MSDRETDSHGKAKLTAIDNENFLSDNSDNIYNVEYSPGPIKVVTLFSGDSPDPVIKEKLDLTSEMDRLTFAIEAQKKGLLADTSVVNAELLELSKRTKMPQPKDKVSEISATVVQATGISRDRLRSQTLLKRGSLSRSLKASLRT